MLVSHLIANALKKEAIKDIFMLTGYGAMYLNDAIEQAGIKCFAARNEIAIIMNSMNLGSSFFISVITIVLTDKCTQWGICYNKKAPTERGL